MFSAFRIQWNELVIILQYFARVSDQIAMANPGLGAAGALWISGAKLGTRGEDTSLIIFANSPLANFSTLVRLPFHDVRLHGGTRPHVAGKRMLEFRRRHPLPSSFHGSFSNSFEFKLCRWFSGVERYGWKFKQGIFLLKERVSP